jgi:hypothetical protein
MAGHPLDQDFSPKLNFPPNGCLDPGWPILSTLVALCS